MMPIKPDKIKSISIPKDEEPKMKIKKWEIKPLEAIDEQKIEITSQNVVPLGKSLTHNTLQKAINTLKQPVPETAPPSWWNEPKKPFPAKAYITKFHNDRGHKIIPENCKACSVLRGFFEWSNKKGYTLI